VEPKVNKAALEVSTLVQDVIRPLEEKGVIAATLALGVRKWQGVILMPHRETNGGMWEERRVRLDRIQKGEGAYRRMDVKCVFGLSICFRGLDLRWLPS
jgi:DNA polymerase beta